jgi:hypothetical protein
VILKKFARDPALQVCSQLSCSVLNRVCAERLNSYLLESALPKAAVAAVNFAIFGRRFGQVHFSLARSNSEGGV